MVLGSSSVDLAVLGAQEMQDSSLLQEIKREVTSLCGSRVLDRFPGSQPVSFDKHALKTVTTTHYVVCEKSDGQRFMLLATDKFSDPSDRRNVGVAGSVLTVNGVNDRSRVYLIDREFKVFVLPKDLLQIPIRDARTNAYGATLLDGEMVVDSVAGQTYTRYLIYDAVCVCGENVRTHNLMQRLQAVMLGVVRRREELKLNMQARKLQVFLKDFFEVTQCRQVLEIATRLPHECDGLIFTPVKLPYVCGTCKQLLKWKPPHMNTVDFGCVVLENSAGTDVNVRLDHATFGMREFSGWFLSKNAGDGWLQVLEDPGHFDGQIVECSWDPSIETTIFTSGNKYTTRVLEVRQGGWVVQRVRNDRQLPNDHRVVDRVLMSIRDGVSFDELERSIQRAHKSVGVDFCKNVVRRGPRQRMSLTPHRNGVSPESGQPNTAEPAAEMADSPDRGTLTTAVAEPGEAEAEAEAPSGKRGMHSMAVAVAAVPTRTTDGGASGPQEEEGDVEKGAKKPRKSWNPGTLAGDEAEPSAALTMSSSDTLPLQQQHVCPTPRSSSRKCDCLATVCLIGRSQGIVAAAVDAGAAVYSCVSLSTSATRVFYLFHDQVTAQALACQLFSGFGSVASPLWLPLQCVLVADLLRSGCACAMLPVLFASSKGTAQINVSEHVECGLRVASLASPVMSVGSWLGSVMACTSPCWAFADLVTGGVLSGGLAVVSLVHWLSTKSSCLAERLNVMALSAAGAVAGSSVGALAALALGKANLAGITAIYGGLCVLGGGSSALMGMACVGLLSGIGAATTGACALLGVERRQRTQAGRSKADVARRPPQNACDFL